MRVSLATHGGQMAAINMRRPPEVVDTADLSEVASQELARLVRAARAAPPIARSDPALARDAMSYTITIDDGSTPIVLVQTDVKMNPSFRALRDWIKSNTRK
jgi:hypothetical protein